MQTEQLIKGITAKLSKSRLVFWYDPEQSFLTLLPEIIIDTVILLDMSAVSFFEVKKRIELDEPHQAFLLYFPYAEPDADQDWLLDIRLYSEQFYADASSMLLNELGIPQMALREHIRQRERFFNNQQRLSALKALITEDENAASLDEKMIAVITKADSAALNDSLLQLFKSYADLSADEISPLIVSLDKYGLLPALWKGLAIQFAYESDAPSLAHFVLSLFCTELWSQIETDDKAWLINNVLTTSSGKATALAFMSSWRDSRQFSTYHDVLSDKVANQLELDSRYKGYAPHALVECDSFQLIEQLIIRGLVKSLLESSEKLNSIQFKATVSARLSRHWCISKAEYRLIYKALQQAEQLFTLREQFIDGFHYESLDMMYVAYTTDLYRFDQAYRLFNESLAIILSKGSDILRALDEEIEKLYSQWYLYELGIEWDRLLTAENGLETWQIKGIDKQSQFYEQQVAKTFKTSKIKRVFVIISDALRYEVADELALNINNEAQFTASLSSQLGVLPSYTQLGMAALLPHQHLSYNIEKNFVVSADDVSTQGLEARHSILKKVNGLAVNAKTLMSWSNQEGRANVESAQVVYIYHDTIDAIGDKLATEEKTFEACHDAIRELQDLIQRVISRLNGSRVIVTADHGFLFQKQALTQADKTVLSYQPEGNVESKKRYIIGNSLLKHEHCWHGKLSHTANVKGDTECLIPKGISRFNFMGGAKFVHGGAMLQEICVPIITVSALRTEKREQYSKQAVGVIVHSQAIKIVTNIDKISFIQADPVNEHFIARQLDVFIINSTGDTVSSRERVNFDSENKSMDERHREVKIKLIGSDFARHETYTLVLEDTDTKLRYQQYAVTIDLAIHDDFF